MAEEQKKVRTRRQRPTTAKRKTRVRKESRERLSREESDLLKGEKVNYEIQIDYAHQYSDRFYELYIKNFEPNPGKRLWYRFNKRTCDIIFSLIGIILCLPLYIIIAIAIKIDSKGPVIFKNKRVGKDGKIFNCWKFRSMSTEAPKEVATSLGGTDMYITKVGRFIRKTSLDEIPQFFNVLSGKMSLIGYRPLVTTEIKANEMRKQLSVFNMKPGISGYAQVKGRDDVYYKNKAIMDAYYVKNSCLWFDIKLVFLTVKTIIVGKSNWDKRDYNR